MEESKRLSGYELSRQWFDFCFENPDLIKPNHTALYFFAIEHCNRLGWKYKYGLPTTMAMEAIGIKSYNTYKNTLDDLVEWGFIVMVERSKNQYSSNIVALSKNDKAIDKALDNALLKHDTKQSESTSESIVSIDKPITLNKEPIESTHTQKKFVKPTFEQAFEYFLEKKWGCAVDFDEKKEAEKFLDFYESKGWKVGRNAMKDWQAAIRNWIKGIKPEQYNGKPTDKNSALRAEIAKRNGLNTGN